MPSLCPASVFFLPPWLFSLVLIILTNYLWNVSWLELLSWPWAISAADITNLAHAFDPELQLQTLLDKTLQAATTNGYTLGKTVAY